MFFLDWFKSFLGFFGLWPKYCKLLILGLDNAGKTTLLHRLKNDHFKQHSPTWLPTSESFTVDGLTITAYDLGGHRQARRVWKEYVPAVDCIVFMVDTAEKERFAEVKAELDSLLSDEQVSDIPILILGNKIDLRDAVSDEELKHRLNIFGVLTGKQTTKQEDRLPGRPLEVFMCSVLMRQGYGDGLRWLSSQLNK